jgi:hypothetical protein
MERGQELPDPLRQPYRIGRAGEPGVTVTPREPPMSLAAPPRNTNLLANPVPEATSTAARGVPHKDRAS